MSNELLSPVIISKDLLVRWENETVMSKFVTREYENRFAIQNEKIGLI